MPMIETSSYEFIDLSSGYLRISPTGNILTGATKVMLNGIKYYITILHPDDIAFRHWTITCLSDEEWQMKSTDKARHVDDINRIINICNKMTDDQKPFADFILASCSR